MELIVSLSFERLSFLQPTGIALEKQCVGKVCDTLVQMQLLGYALNAKSIAIMSIDERWHLLFVLYSTSELTMLCHRMNIQFYLPAGTLKPRDEPINAFQLKASRLHCFNWREVWFETKRNTIFCLLKHFDCVFKNISVVFLWFGSAPKYRYFSSVLSFYLSLFAKYFWSASTMMLVVYFILCKCNLWKTASMGR